MVSCDMPVKTKQRTHYQFEFGGMTVEIESDSENVNQWIKPSKPIPIRQRIVVGGVFVVGEAVYRGFDGVFELSAFRKASNERLRIRLVEDRLCSFRRVESKAYPPPDDPSGYQDKLALAWLHLPGSDAMEARLDEPIPGPRCHSRRSEWIRVQVETSVEGGFSDFEIFLTMQENGIVEYQINK